MSDYVSLDDVPTAYKVVARHRSKESQKTWRSGKPGTQAKKTVYTSLTDYNKYAPDLFKRWNNCWDVSVYKLVNNKWEDLF